jgi:hypothetical protein
MPVEIKELVIRAVIKDENKSDQANGSAFQPDLFDQQAIVEACVKQVLKILKRKQER